MHNDSASIKFISAEIRAIQFSARDRLKLLAGLGFLATGACTGGGATPATSAPIAPVSPPPPPPANALKDVFSSDFLIGAAVPTAQVSNGGIDEVLARQYFSSFTSEYEMKADKIAPTKGVYNFAPGDDLLNFAQANGASVRGHALVWYRTTPDYFTMGNAGDIRSTLETYIQDVVSHYAGQIAAWDVVNEAASDDPAQIYRQDAWFQAVGKDYIDWAFQTARAAGLPNLTGPTSLREPAVGL